MFAELFRGIINGSVRHLNLVFIPVVGCESKTQFHASAVIQIMMEQNDIPTQVKFCLSCARGCANYFSSNEERVSWARKDSVGERWPGTLQLDLVVNLTRTS